MRAFAARIVALVKLVEAYWPSISATGLAAYAVVNTVANGGDRDSLQAAIGTLVLTVVHFSRTPVSRPRNSDGTPLVPDVPPAPQPVDTVTLARDVAKQVALAIQPPDAALEKVVRHITPLPAKKVAKKSPAKKAAPVKKA